MSRIDQFKFWLKKITKGFMWIFGIFMFFGVMVFAENLLGFTNGPFQKISDSIQEILNPQPPPSNPSEPVRSEHPQSIEKDGCPACGMG